MKKINNYINRKKSVITGNGLEIIHTIKNFPIFFGCVNHPKENDLFADMVWGIDPKCGAIQLTKLIPLELIYQEQHFDGTGPTWKKYYEDFSSYILDKKPTKVLEIGGGNGQLAITTTESDSNIRWILLEPNSTIKETNRIKVIPEFFESTLKLEDKIDTVIFSQVLEHAYNPKQFIKNIANLLPIDGKVIFAYPQLTSWLDKKFTNALSFEHTILIDDFIEYLFIEQGFVILNKDIYKNHSTFFYAVKKEKKPLNISIPNMYNEYKSLYQNFISHNKKLVRELNLKVKKSKLPTYLFGAHIFASYLFSLGLNANLSGILDNSKTKQNRRLYGTDFIVLSPKILKGKGPVNLILRAGVYNEEIKKDIIDNINSEVIFL